MKDQFGQELEVGDAIVYSKGDGYGSRSFIPTLAEVTKVCSVKRYDYWRKEDVVHNYITVRPVVVSRDGKRLYKFSRALKKPERVIKVSRDLLP